MLRKPRGLPPSVLEIRPIADTDQDWKVVEPRNQSLEQPPALVIGQEYILEHQHEGASPHTPAYEPHQRLADPTPSLRRIQPQPFSVRRCESEQISHRCQMARAFVGPFRGQC